MFFVAFFTLFWALLSYFTLVCAFLSQNQKYAHFQGWNYRKNYRKPINRHFSNYRQKYRYRFKTSSNYRWFEEIIGKVIDIEIDSKIIEKLSLSKKMGYRTPLAVTVQMLLNLGIGIGMSGVHGCHETLNQTPWITNVVVFELTEYATVCLT